MRDALISTRLMLACGLTLGTATMAMAEVTLTTAAGNTKLHQLGHNRQQHTFVVTRKVVQPGATVDRALSEQPVRPWLIELHVVNTVTYVDPQANYLGEDFRIDEDHYLVEAQRLWHQLHAKPVHVVRNGVAGDAIDVDGIRPRMILLRPATQGGEQPGQMPAVPRPQNDEPKSSRLIAQRD